MVDTLKDNPVENVADLKGKTRYKSDICPDLGQGKQYKETLAILI